MSLLHKIEKIIAGDEVCTSRIEISESTGQVEALDGQGIQKSKMPAGDRGVFDRAIFERSV